MKNWIYAPKEFQLELNEKFGADDEQTTKRIYQTELHEPKADQIPNINFIKRFPIFKDFKSKNRKSWRNSRHVHSLWCPRLKLSKF